jgi:ADP-ribose pyrophosphatase
VPLKGAVIEYPAGLVGDEDDSTHESFEAAARRELLEESGYEAGELEFLLRGPSSPGSSTELVYFYLARDARKVHDGGGVGHERIRVRRVKLDEAEAWLKTKTSSGVLVDPRVYLGIHYARERYKRP